METDPARMAAILLGLKNARVLGAGEDDEGLVAEVETELDPGVVCCPACGSSVVLDGSHEVEQDGPAVFGRPAVLIWRLRRFRCENASCATDTFVEELPPLTKA
jgi:hypothetical protein